MKGEPLEKAAPAKMNKQFARRLDRLERRLTPKPSYELVWVTGSVDEHRRRALAPGERIVLDEYGKCGPTVLARERITTDPLDHGQRSPRGGEVEDILPGGT